MIDSVTFRLRMQPLYDAIPNCPEILVRKYRGPDLPVGTPITIYLKGSDLDTMTAIIKEYGALFTNHKEEVFAHLDLDKASIEYASREGVRETLLRHFYLGGWFAP